MFKSSSEAPFLRKVGKFKIGLNLVEGPMEIMQIRAYSKRSYEKLKQNLIYSSSLLRLLHNSQSLFKAIFYLHIGARFISQGSELANGTIAHCNIRLHSCQWWKLLSVGHCPTKML